MSLIELIRPTTWSFQEEDIWRVRNNEELNRSINGEDIVTFIRAQRIRWLGHVKRMEVGAMPRKTGYRKKERKTSFEMDGRCGRRPEGNEDKAVDGDDAR